MTSSFTTEGFEIIRGILSETQLAALREEAERVAISAGSVCVRHLRSRSEIFDKLSESNMILSHLPEGLRPVRSILFDKTPEENWPVPWHQDITIAVSEEHDVPGYGPWSHKDGVPHVQPPIALLHHMVTIRLHLDDTPAANGALRVIPRSNLRGKISADSITANDKENAITCECMAGDAVLMSPLLLHASQRSLEPARRRVIHLEYARPDDLDPKLSWFEKLA